MGLFKALVKLGTAVKDVALIPVDVAKDVIDFDLRQERVPKRVNKIEGDLRDAYEETFGDE